MTRILVLLTISASCSAQRLAVGIKAGARLTDDVEAAAAPESKRYVVGPMVELKLLKGLAVEFDALYNRFGYRTANSDILGGGYVERVRGNTWEFPILAKYHFKLPYLLLGYSPRRTAVQARGNGVSVSIIGPSSPYEYSRDYGLRTTHGLVTGAGLNLPAGPLRLSPEVRYTRWNADPIGIQGSRGFSIRGVQNEVKLLLGITWH